MAGVRLEGLRDCSKILDAAGRWRQTCVRISDEIIYFCRTYMNAARLRDRRFGDTVAHLAL